MKRNGRTNTEHLLHIMKDGAKIYGRWDKNDLIIRIERRPGYQAIKSYIPMLGIDNRYDKMEQIRNDLYCTVSFRYDEDDYFELLPDRTEGYTESEQTLLFHYTYGQMPRYVQKMQDLKLADNLYDEYGPGDIMFETQPQQILRNMMETAENNCLNLDDSILKHFGDLQSDQNMIHNLGMHMNMTSKQIINMCNKILTDLKGKLNEKPVTGN